MKQRRVFSGHLFRNNVRSNLILTIAILLIMIMMANIINVAMSLMATEKIPAQVEDSQEDFFRYLAVMGVQNEKASMEKQQYKAQLKVQKKAVRKMKDSLWEVDANKEEAEAALQGSAAALQKQAKKVKKAAKKQQKLAKVLQKKSVAAAVAKVTGMNAPQAALELQKTVKKVKKQKKKATRAQKKLERLTKEQAAAAAKFQTAAVIQMMTHQNLEKQREAVTELKDKYREAKEKTKHRYSYRDFLEAGGSRLEEYRDMFRDATEEDEDGFVYTEKGLRDLIKVMETSPVSMEKYEQEFEYVFALKKGDGTFSGKELDIEDMMETTMEINGISSTLVNSDGGLDVTYMLNRMYFTVIGLLPIFLLIVILANVLMAGQVDSGAMAYILSTPTSRSAVAITNILYLVLLPLVVIGVVCATRLVTNTVFHGGTYVGRTLVQYAGFYLLAEAMAGICYLGSCLFNKSRHALAFGGGIAVWFFLASLLGLFGSRNLVDMGIGVEKLNIFNRMTLVSLFDIDALSEVGAGGEGLREILLNGGLDAAGDALWKLGVLAAVALACYLVGTVRFCRKDLPL